MGLGNEVIVQCDSGSTVLCFLLGAEEGLRGEAETVDDDGGRELRDMIWALFGAAVFGRSPTPLNAQLLQHHLLVPRHSLQGGLGLLCQLILA